VTRSTFFTPPSFITFAICLSFPPLLLHRHFKATLRDLWKRMDIYYGGSEGDGLEPMAWDRSIPKSAKKMEEDEPLVVEFVLNDIMPESLAKNVVMVALLKVIKSNTVIKEM